MLYNTLQSNHKVSTQILNSNTLSGHELPEFLNPVTNVWNSFYQGEWGQRKIPTIVKAGISGKQIFAMGSNPKNKQSIPYDFKKFLKHSKNPKGVFNSKLVLNIFL